MDHFINSDFHSEILQDKVRTDNWIRTVNPRMSVHIIFYLVRDTIFLILFVKQQLSKVPINFIPNNKMNSIM